MNGLLYELRGVAKARSGFTLEVPCLSLAVGGTIALTGPSGVGKSTLLELLAFALPPTRAERFRFDGIDVAAQPAAALDRLRGRRVGFVTQSGGLLPFLTVRENIALPVRIAGVAPVSVEALAERLGIADQLGKLPADLSVGQRQRAAVARALVHRPAVVLADEPTAALDPDSAERVAALLQQETAATGAALVLASHDHGLIERLGLPRMELGFARSRAAARLAA